MNSVEKRHSSRRSSGHRKHSDGGYSDTSSVGSFPDETDREVSNLTDRAFRSLCIGDEAVYNDSDLSAASPSGRTERQQAFCQSGRDWKREDPKRAGQESYGLQLQQYGQEWVPGAETQGDPRWAGTLEGRTGGRVSETFQHALMDGSLHQRSLNKEPVSPLSNGAPEFSTQGRRSRSRVSSLIKAFNSDGIRDGAGQDGKLKEWNNEGNWDKSALMSIQRELSEFSTAYGQNLNSTPFSPAGPYSSQDSFYSSQVATAHVDSSSFMRSTHSQHSVSSLYSSSVSNVFIHSEYSPFRVWRRAHDRYPYQHGDVSGYMGCSDFQTWYETPLYKELSLGPETQQRVPMQEQWAAEPPPRKPLEHVALPPALRSSSTSTVLHKASAVQKRCESELAEFHTMRKRTQSLGNNKHPSQRPSTVSPTIEMLRRGRDTTLNSINDLQQKFRMMTSEHSVAAEMMGNPHGVLPRYDSFTQFAGEPVVDSNACPAPFSKSQSHTPGVYPHQEVRTSEVNQCALSPPAMEHAPVRAESRGATPDVRLSGYKARATSLLFNLKDNRKRVKSTYSPPKFKGLENFDRNKQVIKNEGMEQPRDTVINIPEFQYSDLPQVVMQQGPSVDPHTTSHQPLTGYHSPGVTAFNPHLTAAYEVQRNDYVSGDYLAPPTQSEMFHHTGFNSYPQDERTSNPHAHGHVQQQEYVPSFANNIHANNMNKTGTSVGHAYRQERDNQLGISNTIHMAASPQPQTIYSATEVPRLHDYTNQTAYQMNTASDKQYFKESTCGDMTHVDRYEQVKDNTYAFTAGKHYCQDKETPCVTDKFNTQLPTEAPSSTENDPNAQFDPEMDMMPDMLLLPPPEYGSSEDWNMSSTKEEDNLEFDESNAEGFPVYPQKDGVHSPYHTLVNPYLSNQPNQLQQYSVSTTLSTPGGTAANEKQPSRTLQEYRVHNQQDGIKEIQSTEKYPQTRNTEQEHTKQKSYDHDGHGNYMFTQESSQQDIEVLEKANKPRDQQDAGKQQYELNLMEKTLTADPMQCIAKPPFLKNQDREIQHVNVKEKPKEKINEKQPILTELSKQLEWAQTLQTKLESVRAGLTEELVALRATEEKTEQTTERLLVEGQPHGKQTVTDEVNVVQSEDANIKEQEDKQVIAHPAEVDQGMKSQQNKDERTMVELKERSMAREDEVEVAQKECIETIRISPDGKAKGEVLARREPGAEQAKEGQKPAGTIPAGVIKMKQSEKVQIVTGAPVEPIKAQLSKTGMEKAKLPKMDETKAVHIKADDDIKEKGTDELLRAEKINADPPKVEQVKDPFRTKPAQAEKAEVKIEKAKEEPNNVLTARDEQSKAEQGRAVKPEKCGPAPARIAQAKIEHAKEKREQAKSLSEKRMEHSVESLLIRKAEKDKLKQGPDRVEKVKTELAKAKVELAKFKEKMKEEQKVKQNKAIVSKAVDKNVLQKEKQPPPYQQTEEPPVTVVVDEYERMREKYGFSETTLANRNLASANDVASPSQDMEMSRSHSAKGEEASDISKPKDAENPQSQAATEDEAKSPSAKGEEFRENQYVYSETSKEFKLTSPNDSSASPVTQQMASEIGTDTNTKDKMLSAKPGPVSANIDVSQPGGSNINPTKSHMNMNTHERKLNPNKDTHSTSSRTLSHKERTQTKQEILTSKIKAHAEKEISAIKEKHFASGKNVQQRLPLQEVTKPLDKNITHSVALRDPHATAPVKTNISKTETTPAVMPSNTTASLLDSQVQKQEPLKSVQDTVVQLPMALNQTKNIDNRNEELKQREKKSATKATSQIKEQTLIRQSAEEITTPKKNKADPPPSKPEESSKNETPQTSDTVMGETQERPEGKLLVKLGFGQDGAPANDDSLQIMGIMVSVRATTETVGTNDEDGGAKKDAPEKAMIDSEINDDIKPSGNLCLETDIYNGRAEEEKQFVHASQPTVGTVHTKVGANNHPDESEETTDRLENKMADLTDKRLTAQKEGSLTTKTSNSHAVHQEDPVANQEYSSTITKPAPNKPGKTQPILFKQGKITEKAKIYTNKNSNEAKSNVKGKVGNDPSLAKAMETGFNSQMSSSSDIKSSKMQIHPASENDSVPSTKTDKVQDGGSVPLLVDKEIHPSLPEAEPQNKNRTSPDLKGPENVHIFIGQQCERTPGEENNQEDGNVHIGCIAIRVVPGVTVQDDQEKAGEEVVAETMNTERNMDGTPAIKPSTENVVQQVQQTGPSNQSSKVTDSRETKRDEDETLQKSKIAAATAVDGNNTMVQATEEEYFQFQGVTERSQERDKTMEDSASMQGLPKEHTEELNVQRMSSSGDITGLPSDKTVKTELSSQQKAKQVTNEDKVLDNTSKTTMESDSEASEKLSKSDKSGQDSKNSRVFPERQSNQKLHNIETGEDITILKQATQSTFHASGKEKQSVRDSHTTRNDRVGASKEQPNYKQESKSKPRASAIPEISAIADYARLKVIAADDEPDKIQEFPPNKKEGFFPMIQSRHSRRPVFTAETPERQTVSKKTVLKEPEPSPKVNKEPKFPVFSTMEQDHKRTGMFKLREKENVLSDVKTKDKADDDKMHTQDPTGTPQAVSEDFQYWSRDTAKVAGPTLSSSANINQTNTSFSQPSTQPTDNSTATERPQGGEVFTEQRTGPQVDNNSHQQGMFGKMFNREKNRGDRSNAIASEAKSKENEEAMAAKQRQENKIIQQINEERRATLESQKREARRAREREARAARIEEERRETQREAERVAEEEKRAQLLKERAARIEEERRETQREAERVAEEERRAQLLKEKAAQEEMEKKREEEEKRAAEEERRKKRREEERRRKETEERIAAQIQEEMRRAKQREEERRAREEEARVAKEAEDRKRDKRREEDRRVAQIQEERRAAQVEEERREREEEMTRAEEERRAKHREIEQRIKEHEERRAAKLEEERMKRKQEEAHRREERQGEIREEGALPAPIEADRPSLKVEHEGQVGMEGEQPPPQMEPRKAAPLMDALQYYAISSSANSREKHPPSPGPPRRRGEPTRQVATPDESLSSPPAPSSPAPVPRSTTSSPAPGPKPILFRVKDNTLRASSLTKSVKPRLHKSFGEEFRVSSPLAEHRGSDRAEEERDRARRATGTPVHQEPVSRSHRPPAVKESPPAPPQPPSSVPEPRAPRAEHRPYSRRSMAPDEDDSRSGVSNMSEDVESFATSVGDLSDFRGFCDYERPESACSFSSDVSRSLGKPPSVPPKSDKALKRAQRLTTRRLKKGLVKSPEEGPVPEENRLPSAGSSPSSASELRSSSLHARASPHFSAPFSLTHAPASASSAPSSHAETPSAYRYSHASPHATGSVSTPHATGPVTSPHATLPVSTPFASAHTTTAAARSPHVSAPAYPPVGSPHHSPAASLPVASKTIASTPSSPVLRRRAAVTPVKQYHVEPGYTTQSYPLTQPKVLQDPGSGQYYVVEMPVEVKTKTFFDPETGKYVQLNVRQSAQGGFQAPPQHTAYQQPRIPQTQLHVQALPQVYPQVATPGKSFVVYPGYPPGRQSMPVSTLPPQRSYSGMSLPETLSHPVQSAREGQNNSYHGYNSEETPYMDTAYETATICDTNKVNHGGYEKYPEADTNSHPQEGYEDDTPARSSQEQRDIITMSELEDFMDVSDW